MHVTDRTRLRKQYADDARLAVRIETHRRYSERRENIADWVLGLLGPQPGDLVLDAGAGNGSYHPALETRQVRAVAVERELGMIRSASDSQAAFVAGDVSELPLRPTWSITAWRITCCTTCLTFRERWRNLRG